MKRCTHVYKAAEHFELSSGSTCVRWATNYDLNKACRLARSRTERIQRPRALWEAPKRHVVFFQADEERVSALAAQLEAELERVAEERRRVAAAVEEAACARRSLEETASRAERDATQMEGQARRKQGAAAAVVTSQRRKDELAEEEKKLREETEVGAGIIRVMHES